MKMARKRDFRKIIGYLIDPCALSSLNSTFCVSRGKSLLTVSKMGECSFPFVDGCQCRDIWTKIWSLVEMFQLSENPDKMMRKWDKKGKFTVKSMYNALTVGDNDAYLKQIWKGKIPPKIKFFMWLL